MKLMKETRTLTSTSTGKPYPELFHSKKEPFYYHRRDKERFNRTIIMNNKQDYFGV